MTAQAGKDMLLKIEGAPGVFTTVAGLRARTISLNAKTVDATDGDSAGRWRELLAGAGVKSAAVSGQGIFRDAASDALVREAFFDQAAKRWRLGVDGLAAVAERMKALSARDLMVVLAAVLRGGGETEPDVAAVDPREAAVAVAQAFAAAAR